jgi:hypothetical protein
MSVTIQQISTDVTGISGIANSIMNTIEGLDPALAAPLEAVKAVESLASAALTAWSNASGTPITVASVQALLPNAAPLTKPTS